MASVFSRVKTWAAEVLTPADLNAEFDNILDNFDADQMGGYSTNTTEMRQQTDPGEQGTESLATTVAGEIERLRQAIAESKGTTYWYETANASLNSLNNLIALSTPPSRLASSATVSATDTMSKYLIANGSALTVAVEADPTAISVVIDGAVVAITADGSITSLQAAPSSNNTCLVNDTALSDQQYTKHLGEHGTTIPIDNVGSEISGKDGELAAFSLNNGVDTEYFIAKIDIGNGVLKDCRRGYFFDSSYVSVPRITLADNDTITLLNLGWVYVVNDGTYLVSYNNPQISGDEPSSPNEGDFWYDLTADTWKRVVSGAYEVADATFFGYIANTATVCIASRGLDIHKTWVDVISMSLVRTSNTVIDGKDVLKDLNVNGVALRMQNDLPNWDITVNLESGVTEGASTIYYLYIDEFGDEFMSDKIPQDRRGDLKGLYHPSRMWRCVGECYNDASSNIVSVKSYENTYTLADDPIDSATTTATIAFDSSETITLDSAGGAYTVTLPSAINRAGFELFLIKTSSDTNLITIDGAGSETINGRTTEVLARQYGYLRLLSDGSNWLIKDRTMLRDEMLFKGYNGYGSTNNKIFNFDSQYNDDTPHDLLTAVYDSATDGNSFTLTRDMYVKATLSHTVVNSAINQYRGFTRNSSELTTSVATVTAADVLTRIFSSPSATIRTTITIHWEGSLSSGDILRVHGDGTAPQDDASHQLLVIAEVG